MDRTSEKIFARLASKSESAIIVASCGRSGSTMLTKALAFSSLYRIFQMGPDIFQNALIKQAWRLEKVCFQPGFIYKTHDHPPSKIRSHKYVYVYSSPCRVIPSLVKKAHEEGKIWLKNHAKHLKGSFDSIDRMIDGDSLRIKENIEKWLHVARETKNVMALRYEDIWSNQDQLTEFLGFDVCLPRRKSRKSSMEVLSRDQLEKMIRKFECMDDLVDVETNS